MSAEGRADDAGYVLGVDVGTGGVRAAVIDSQGSMLGFSIASLPTRHPRPGWATQEPEHWWQSLIRAVREAVEAAGIAATAVEALSIGATSCSLVALDSSGEPLSPAIIWMDVRAADETEDIARLGDGLLHFSGGRSTSPEWLLSKALWLKRHEPELFERTAWLAESVDYLSWRLSGRRVASLNTASIRAYYDTEGEGWPRSLFDRCGIAELLEKLPAEVLPMGDAIGEMRVDAASALGLAPGTLVVTGGADAFVGQVGLGVTEPGSLALITGSSHLMLLQSETRAHADGIFGSYPDCVVPGQYTLEGGQAATGSMIDWYRKLVTDGSETTGFFEQATAQAERLPPGSDGLLVVDHWQGNRTPFLDGSSRGAILGLTLSHTRAHVFRAMLESVCYGVETTLRRFRQQGLPLDRIVVCGGAVNSPFWLQLHADVIGSPIEVTEVSESVALGAGVLAAVGCGWFDSIGDAARAMVKTSYTVTPDPAKHSSYQPFIEAYGAAYRQLIEVQHELASHQRAA